MHSMKNSATKSTGIYRCVDDINNLIFRVQIKEITGESAVEDAVTKSDVESMNFHWQQKIFGRWEKDFYKDKSNCVTDLDCRYHTEVCKILDRDDVLYSYVNDDEFCRQDEPISNSRNESFLRNKNLNSDVVRTNSFNQDFSDHLLECTRDPFYNCDFQYMYIMADFGEYFENTWIKSEYIICCLKYDEQRNILFIYPDFTKFYAYTMMVNNDMSKCYEIRIENMSELIATEILEREKKIIDKIASHEKKLKDHVVGVEFATPADDQLLTYVLFEILTAKNMEYDDIYVQYTLDLPEHWSCLSGATSLRGSTQSCRTRGSVAHFAYVFEVILCCDLKEIEKIRTLPSPNIYFEVISKDTWDRYRTEGLCYKNLPLFKPGNYLFEMQCYRILPGSLTASLRRFFIGDYRRYEDVRWISKAKDHDDVILNKYGVGTVSTGQVSFKVDIVHQSRRPSEDTKQERMIMNRLLSASSPLMKSVEQVLEAFKLAKRNMLEARRRI